jgi:hypothetical protein
MMGCPIPKAMDGRVLREIFLPGSEPDERATMWTDSEPKAQPKKGMTEEEDATIAERLQNLGYI